MLPLMPRRRGAGRPNRRRRSGGRPRACSSPTSSVRAGSGNANPTPWRNSLVSDHAAIAAPCSSVPRPADQGARARAIRRSRSSNLRPPRCTPRSRCRRSSPRSRGRRRSRSGCACAVSTGDVVDRAGELLGLEISRAARIRAPGARWRDPARRRDRGDGRGLGTARKRADRSRRTRAARAAATRTRLRAPWCGERRGSPRDHVALRLHRATLTVRDA